MCKCRDVKILLDMARIKVKRYFSQFLIVAETAICDPKWAEVVIGSHRFRVVLVCPISSHRFPLVLIGSCRFPVVLTGSQWFS